VWVHLLLVVVALLWNVALVLTARLGHGRQSTGLVGNRNFEVVALHSTDSETEVE
jgi:hypothetical protein